MTSIAAASLIAATITTGLTAGLLYGFAHTVMPGLGRVGDRAFIAAFQAMDRMIINPWFGVAFLGGPVFTALALFLHLGAERRAVAPWVLVAFLLHLVVLVITMMVNVPLNQRLHAAGDPERMSDPATVRGRFEDRWVRWNVVRTVAAVAAFGSLALAAAG